MSDDDDDDYLDVDLESDDWGAEPEPFMHQWLKDQGEIVVETHNKKWYEIKDANDVSYTPYRVSKRVLEYLGDGSRRPTPKEVAEYLEKHPDADCEWDGLYFERRDNDNTDSIEVDLPAGIYKYREAGGGRYPERLQPFKMRSDQGTNLGGKFHEVTDRIANFIANEKVYRDNDIMYKLGLLLYGPPGNGKCLGKGTPVILYDGSVKPVEDVICGDTLLGPDSKPRLVVSLARGRERMYQVTPNKGDSFTCNESHILSLIVGHKIVNISVKQYLTQSATFKHQAKLWRPAEIQFREKLQTIDPYMLGAWLGDGTSGTSEITNTDVAVLEQIAVCAEASGLTLTPKSKDSITYRIGTGTKYGAKDRNEFLNELRKLELINNKHIPLEYKTGSEEQRLQLLAGLLDTDGSVNGPGFEFSNKNEQLCDDVLYVCRSLGFAAYKHPVQKTCTNTGSVGNYFRVTISGDCRRIPVMERKLPAERTQDKCVTHVGFELKDLGEGEYFGFELAALDWGLDLTGDDRLFLLGDFTVTHNTTLIRQVVKAAAPADALVIFIDEKFPSSDFMIKICETLPDALKIFIFEELANSVQYWHTGRLLDFLDGESSIDRSILLSTTNFPEKIPGNIVERPSRFDDIYDFGNPDDDQREKLLSYFLKREVSLEDVVTTKNLSIDQIKQVCLLVLLHGTTVKQGVDKMKKRTALCKKAFAEFKEGIGF